MSNFDANESLRELCSIGDLDLLRKFIEQHNPDINSQNKMNGWTALHWACKRNLPSVAKFLIDKGASNEITNKDGKKPSFYTTTDEIKRLLNDNSESQSKPNTSDFVPNYLRNPEFVYLNSDRFMVIDDEPKEVPDEPKNKTPLAKSKKYFDVKDNSAEDTSNECSMITVRVRVNTDNDFIEFDFDKSSTTFEEFKDLCVRELELERNRPIELIRKLPNILIRSIKDIQRLKNEQEIEICF